MDNWKIWVAKIFGLKVAILIHHDNKFSTTYVSNDLRGQLWGSIYSNRLRLNQDGTVTGASYIHRWEPLYPPRYAGELAEGCKRSHPHEEMSGDCRRITELEEKLRDALKKSQGEGDAP